MAQRNSAQAPESVPVIIVAGFLGSGKTTLLNHLLRNSRGMRIGVLVNDFGAVNVDAMLVAGQVDSTMTLSNGCMCCTVDADELESTLATLVKPRRGMPPLDAIVIEASGLAEPGNLISMVCASTDRRIRYGGLVYLVDGCHHLDNGQQHRYLQSHVGLADLVVINKADLCSSDGIAAVKDSVQQANSTAPCYVTSESRVPFDLLFDPIERAVDDLPRQLGIDELLATDNCAHDHLHDTFESLVISSPEPLHPRRLATLLEQPPAGVYRMKGHVVLANGTSGTVRYALQTVGRSVRVADPAAASGPDTEMVVIGAGIDESDVRREWVAAQVRPGEDVDERAILSIDRYRA